MSRFRRFSNYLPSSPLFGRSPRPDQEVASDASPASTSSPPLSGLHSNVRSMVNGSSVYSQDSPVPSNNSTPKIPFLGFLRRPQSPPDLVVVPDHNDAPRDSNDSRSPLHPQHTAGSYIRTIAPLHDPQEPQTIYTRHPADPQEPETIYTRHPADVPLSYSGTVDPETEQLQDEMHGRRRRHHRRRKHHRQNRHGQWVRRKEERGVCLPFARGEAARGKCIACIISGLFLTTVLSIYLAIALSHKNLGQEIHVLFIMIILATTIFFCHALIRLCMLALYPPTDNGPRIPNMTGPEGFRPIRPIQVHLARDEELGDTDLEDELDREDEAAEAEKEKKVMLPPPAYGLWRSSVRVDPNLLHWQRVNDARDGSPVPPHRFSTAATNSRNGSFTNSRNGSFINSRNGSLSGPAEPTPDPAPQGPRPPSYVSEDGVSYIVEAVPRSTAPAPSHSGVSDIHPAWRPGYTVEQVRMDESPASRGL
ncbi:hypothetical protein K504DRAFT_473188 [Pleomassaria siparia CBS 279.74]|uniref:Uncharacterized protein n=1 Tax=Pleomassaria siparia CBS 279.74 TaxID=1314801 RepID=A0A6G1KNH9_9PLEO|nr:hypothetical protein K504DRAFT_473188 [Pleomassaria siparia CBS 279.74]